MEMECDFGGPEESEAFEAVSESDENESESRRQRQTDTTHGPNHSMARAIQATAWQKVSSVDAPFASLLA